MKLLSLTACLLIINAAPAGAQDEKPKPKPKPKTLDLKALAEEAQQDPDGDRKIVNYVVGFVRKFSTIYRSDIPAAEKIVQRYEANLKQIKPTKVTGKKALVLAKRYALIARRRLESVKIHKALIGKPAPLVKSETWVNGSSLSESDFKGKVVLLDFGAIWCGPCIKQFPNLRTWHDKWADKGLLIVGVTRQYNYRWDEEAKRPKRVDKDEETVSLKEESAMLQKFAKKYKLEHRFAIMGDTSLHKKYGVVGIPQLVLIDQKGIIREALPGASAANAKKIESQLMKLFGETKNATGGK